MIANLVADPRGFFSKQIMYPGAQTQAIIALAVGVTFMLQHIGAYLLLGDTAVDLYEVIFISAVVELLGPIGIWLAATLMTVLVSKVLIGRIRFGDVFRLSGWGMLPLVGAGLIKTAARLYAIRGTEAPELGAYSYIEYEWNQYQSFVNSAADDPLFVVATAIAAVFALYTGYLWMVAIEEIRAEDGFEITRPQALVAAAVPTVLCVLWVTRPLVL